MLATVRFPTVTGFTDLFEDFQTVRKQMNRLVAGFPATSLGGKDAGRFAALNVVEEQDKLFVNVELPGVNPSEIEISVHAKTLTLSGRRNPYDTGNANMSYHLRERGTGNFSKSFTLPFELNPEGVEARYENGLLKIVLPKAESEKTRKITVLNG